MAHVIEESTSVCDHCNRAVPTLNFDLHFAHCPRNLKKCRVCGDMVPRKHYDEHFSNTHAPVACSLCSETMEREVLAIHKGSMWEPDRILSSMQ